MYFYCYLTIITFVIFTVKGTIIHHLPDLQIHDNSPEAYYNKYCGNHKCGEFGECVLLVKIPANDNIDDKYLCRCNECYAGKYCNINICQKEKVFFSPTRLALFLLILLTTMFYIFAFYRFIIFYFKYIHKMKTIMKATNQYFIDSTKNLKDINGKSPTIIILRKAFNVHDKNDKNSTIKTKVSKKNKGKKSTIINKIDDDVKIVPINNNLNQSTTGSETRRLDTTNGDEEKSTTLISTNETTTSKIDDDSTKTLDAQQPNILTPFPTKFKMANMFGKEKLLQLGVIPSSNDKPTEPSKDQNKP